MRILVADQDPQLRELLRTMVEACGHTVVPAADGEEARCLLKGTRFDCALLELRLPKLNGLHLLKLIRRSRRRRLMPVSLMVDHEALAQRVLADERLAVDALLVKPFGTSEVLEAVHLMGSGGPMPLVLGRSHTSVGRRARRPA